MLRTRGHITRWLGVVALLLLVAIGAAAIGAGTGMGTGLGSVATSPKSVAAPAKGAPSGGSAPIAAVNGAAAQPVNQNTLPNGVTVRQDVHHDVSPPLRDIPPAPAIKRDEGPENPSPPSELKAHVNDPVVQNFFGALAMPTPIMNFDGIDSVGSACGCLPPDTNGAVGLTQYVQSVNSSFAVYDKTGNVLLTPRPVNTLFAGFGGPCQTQNSGDPVVLYDRQADRWIVSQFTSAAPYAECFALSQTGDATGAYYRYAFILSNVDFYDYEKISSWPDAYYYSANVFQGNGGFHPSAIAFDRTRMLAGLSATSLEFNPGNFYANLLPSDLDGSMPPPPGEPNTYLSLSGNNTLAHFWKFHVDFTTPANSTFTGPINVQAAPWDPNLCNGSRKCIPQPAPALPTQYLDTLYDHAMFRLAYRNFGDHESLVANESVDENGADHSGIRWYEFRLDDGGDPYIAQQGTYAPDANHRWMGSIAMDRDGNLAVGYNVSSTSVFPSLRYAGRLATDPPGILSQGEATLFDGSGVQTSTSGRWGDYSDMTIDPTDDCTFWFTGEYHGATGNANWRTRIGSFKFPSCGQTTPTPTMTGTPPTATATRPAGTATPVPTACTTYTVTQSTGATIVPGTTDIGNHCDDCTTSITLPFTIQLYSQSFNSAFVSSNGNIQFVSSDSAFGNACLPVPIFYDAVSVYWDDLVTNLAGEGVFTSVSGAAPNRIFNVEWRAGQLSAPPPNPPAPLNFEARFYEGSNQVDMIYNTVGDGGAGDTVGIQKDSGGFTQFECDTAGTITSGLKLTFTAPPCAVPTSTATTTATTAATSTATRTTQPSVTSTSIPPTLTAAPTNTAVPTVCTIEFQDVPTANTFYPYIKCLACRGIIGGYPCGGTGEPCGTTNNPYFRYGANISRGQIAKIVSQSAGFNDAPGAQIYEDVPMASPFYDYINRLSHRGYIGGYPCGQLPSETCITPNNRPYFRPSSNATRGQLSKIVATAAMITDPVSGQIYTDVGTDSPFYKWIQQLSARGVMSGYPCGGAGEPCDSQNRPYFRPNAEVTRGQASKIVANTFSPNCQDRPGPVATATGTPAPVATIPDPTTGPVLSKP